MTCNFTSFSTVFQSYQDDERLIMKAGIIGLGLSVSTILLEIVLGDGPDDFVDVLPGFKSRA